MKRLLYLSALFSFLLLGFARASDRASDVSKVDVVGADFKSTQVMGDGDWDRALITGTTPGGKLLYARGEEIVLSLKLEGLRKPLPSGVYFIDWERTGDDGVTERGREPLPFKDGCFVYRTRSDRPGFVCLEANVVTADGRRVKKSHRWEPRVFFRGGVGVAIDDIPMVPEPEDYTAFWRASLDELAAVPMMPELRETPCADTRVRCYAVRIPCAGPWPVTGYFTVPKTASVTNRLPASVGFRGASQQEQLPPTKPPYDRIDLCINPNGYELGRGPDYVKSFFKGLSEDGAGYGMGPKSNADRRTSYWKYCALRAVRAVQWMKTRPEWNGCTLTLAGGSQGDWQAYHAAANVSGVTRIYADGSWGADWGGQSLLGRLKSSYRPNVWFPDMAYFDPIYAARRIHCPVRICFAGLGDACSTPASLALLYRNLCGPKSITYVQGSTHGWRPVGQQSQTVRDVVSLVQSALERGERKIKVPRTTCRVTSANGRAVLELKGLSDRVIDFAGSEIRLSDGGEFLSLVACTNVSVREARLAVDGHRTERVCAAVRAEGCEGCAFERLEVVNATCAFADIVSTENVYRDCRVRVDGRAVGFAVRQAVIGPRLLGCSVSGDAVVAVDTTRGQNPDVRGLFVDGGTVRLAGSDGRLEDSVFAHGGRMETGEASCCANETWVDAAPAVRTDLMAFVRKEIAHGARRVSIPRARYWLTPPPGEPAYFALFGKSDVEIDFNGSELVGTVQAPMFTLSDCTNVTVRGATVDYADLPFTQAVIECVDGDQNWDVRIISGYPMPSAVALASTSSFWPVQAYGAKTHEPVNFMRYRNGIAITRTGRDTYRVTGGECRAGAVGDIAVWSCVDQTRMARAGAVNVWSSSGCRIEDVCVFSVANDGCGFAEALATSNAYVRCRLLRRDSRTDLFPRGLRRLRSGNHDAFNSRRSFVGPQLDGCVFQYHCDDCVNISGYYTFVLGRSGKSYRVATYAQERLRTGDLCQVLLPDGESPGDACATRVAESAPLTDEERSLFAGLGLWPGCEKNFRAAQEVVLETFVDLPPGTLLGPRRRMGGGYRIQNCTMGHNRARGLLVQASDGLIARNVLEGIEGWAILLAPECAWLEAGVGSRVRIMDNVCRGNGEGFYIGGRSLSGKPFGASARSDIEICGNRIEGANVAVTGCARLRLAGNSILPRENQEPFRLVNVTEVSRSPVPKSVR